MEYRIVNIRTVATEDKGRLSFFEVGPDVPFDIKRIYYIYDAPQDVERGGHAHRNLSQIMFCPYGEIEIELDDGIERMSVLLDDPAKGLMIRNLIWRDMKWRKAGSILAVAASALYDENDYIRNYEEFRKEVRNKDADSIHESQ